MGLRETLADLIAAGEKERQRREDDSTDPGAKPVCIEQQMVTSPLAGTLEIVRNVPSFPRSRLKLS